MKSFRLYHRLSEVVAGLLPLTTQSMAGNGMGGFGGHGPHRSFERGFERQGREGCRTSYEYMRYRSVVSIFVSTGFARSQNGTVSRLYTGRYVQFCFSI
jgi:hypothetical protein